MAASNPPQSTSGSVQTAGRARIPSCESAAIIGRSSSARSGKPAWVTRATFRGRGSPLMQAHSPEIGGGESFGTWLLQPDALRGLGGEARLRALLEHPVEPSEGDAATPTVELFEEPAAPQRPRSGS